MKRSFLGAISNPETGILPRAWREKLFEKLLTDIESGKEKAAERASWALFRIAAKSRDSEKLAAAIPVFEKALGHKSGKVGHYCADVLRMIGERAVPTLIEATKSKNEQKQKHAVRALVSACSILALDTFLDAIEKMPESRYDAIRGIEYIAAKNPNAPELGAAAERCFELSYSKNDGIRKYATMGLGKIGRPEHLDRVAQLMEDHTQMVQLDAVNAMGELLERHPEAKKVPKIIEALKRKIADADSGVRCNAITAVSKAGVKLGLRETMGLIRESSERLKREGNWEAVRSLREHYRAHLDEVEKRAAGHIRAKGLWKGRGNTPGAKKKPENKLMRIGA